MKISAKCVLINVYTFIAYAAVIPVLDYVARDQSDRNTPGFINHRKAISDYPNGEYLQCLTRIKTNRLWIGSLRRRNIRFTPKERDHSLPRGHVTPFVKWNFRILSVFRRASFARGGGRITRRYTRLRASTLLLAAILRSAEVWHRFECVRAGRRICAVMLFRSGKLRADSRVPWRRDSALYDGERVNWDLTGGYYDGNVGLPRIAI